MVDDEATGRRDVGGMGEVCYAKRTWGYPLEERKKI